RRYSKAGFARGCEQYRLVSTTAKGTLSKRALDVLNRATEIKSEIDFCGEDGSLPKEMRHFVGWLGDHLRSELQREAWEEPEVVMDGGGVRPLPVFPEMAVAQCRIRSVLLLVAQSV